MSFQLGSQHYLYLAYTTITTPIVITSLLKADGTEVTPSGVSAKEIVTADLNQTDLIKDVTVGGSNTKVDVTTRQTARQGYSAQLIATSEGTMQVQFAYEPRDDAGTYTRDDLAILQYCFAAKKPIFAIDLDKPLGVATVGGAQGLGANWSIGFSQPKPVQGQVVIDVEFTIESFAQILYTTDGTVLNFRSLV